MFKTAFKIAFIVILQSIAKYYISFVLESSLVQLNFTTVEVDSINLLMVKRLIKL